ncbi:MAG TPA: DUF3473 domain-containing protein [Syntrophobacteraceae bacterium]|nr:DUF3473 domain-containing protein [Syntrophobacteraceae bacterium]
MSKSILLTFDVEDWFQVENLKKCIPFSSWPRCELRVEKSTRRLLDCLDRAFNGRDDSAASTCGPPKATFFVLGWLARQLPNLVREIAARGHEIASHGLYHNLCSQCSIEDLRVDLSESKKILEDIIGSEVHGYRAPSFSIMPEALKLIEECGYTYDSSYNSFSAHKRYGRIDLVQNAHGIANHVLPSLYELPISNLKIGKYTIPMGGGGYFRFMPIWLFKKAVGSIISKQGAYLFYMHPWEIDPEQPRVKGLPFSFRFRHYMNLDVTASKLCDFLRAFSGCRFLTCRGYIGRITEGESVREI